MEFVTHYNYVNPEPPKWSEESDVDIAGYIPRDVEIKRLIDCGEALVIAKQNYDWQEDEEDDFDLQVPVRDRGFDFQDAHDLQRYVSDELAKQKKELEKQFDEKRKVLQKESQDKLKAKFRAEFEAEQKLQNPGPLAPDLSS